MTLIVSKCSVINIILFGKTTSLKDDILLLLSSMIELNIKTLEVKNVLKAFSVAKSNQKIKLLKQAAVSFGTTAFYFFLTWTIGLISVTQY